MARITSTEIYLIKHNAFLRANRAFLVQIMEKDVRTVLEEHIVSGWRNAHTFGYRLIAKCPDNQVVRIVDPNDASCYDFITKQRLEKLKKGGNYNGYADEKEE